MPWLVDEAVPGVAALVDDLVVGGEDAVRQPVVAQELPHILLRIELWNLRWNRDDRDVGWHVKLRGPVPTGQVHEQDRVCARRDVQGELRQVQVHGVGVADQQEQAGSLALLRADRTEDIGRLGTLVVRGRRPDFLLGPPPVDLVLLPNAGFILNPDIYRRTAREGGPDLVQLGGKASFLNASIASGSWA